jgi:hypothetical protein
VLRLIQTGRFGPILLQKSFAPDGCSLVIGWEQPALIAGSDALYTTLTLRDA